MNHIYRIVFNRALGLVQVASELASGRGTGGAPRCRSRPGRRTLLAIALALASGGVLAQVAPGQLPTGANVVGGADGPAMVGEVFTINQTADRALIRWGTFDIGEDARVRFEQQSHQVALNQILDLNPSQIFGELRADGTIFLINPNGIVFGEGAQISVGGLVASTLTPDDPDAFLEMDAGDYVHDSFVWREGGTAGLVVNHGTITSGNGSVTLLGGAAHNMPGASIDVGTGLAALLAGGQAQVELAPGAPPVVSISGVAAGLPATGGTTAVLNAGAVIANGGTIRLHGDHVPGLATAVINTGTLVAAGIGAGPDGSISLVAGADSNASMMVAGTVDAGAGQVTLESAGTIDLVGALTTGGFDVEARQVLQIGGGVQASGASSVVASGTVQLDSAANDFGGPVDITGGTVVIRDMNALSLGTLDVASLAVNTSGALSLGSGAVAASIHATSNGGDISQAGALSVGGNTTLVTGAGDITLGHLANDFTGYVQFVADDVQLRDANALNLFGVNAGSLDVASAGTLVLGTGTITGDLTAGSAGGAIMQTGALSVGGTATIDAGTGGINLPVLNNDFAGTVNLTGRAARLTDQNALTLGALNVRSLEVNSGGALSLGQGVIQEVLIANSGGGAITQAGALEVGLSSTIDAGSGAITLTGEGNDFIGAVHLTGGAVALRDANALTLAGLNVSSLAVTSGGALSLGSGAIAGNLTATSAAGGITQAGALAVAGASAIDAGAGAVTLTNAGNLFAGPVDLAGGAVEIASAGTLTLGQVDATGLEATAATIGLSGDVTTSGDQDYHGAVVLAADAALAAGGNVEFDATLDGAHRLSVDSDGSVTIAGAVGATTALAGLDVDANFFRAASMIRTGGDLSIAVQTGGIIHLGTVSVGGNASFDAGTGNIGLANVGNDFSGTVDLTGAAVTVHDMNALALGMLDVGSLDVRVIDTLDLGRGSIIGNLIALSQMRDIGQSGALAVGGTATIAAAGTVELTNAGNDFVGGVSTQGSTVSLRDANALRLLYAYSLQDFSVLTGGALSLGATYFGGSFVAVSATGGITQTGTLDARGTSSIDAGTGDITLTNAGNDFVGAMDLRGGAVAITDANALTLGQVDATSLHARAATIGLVNDVSTSGDQQYDGALVLGADVALAAGGDVGFDSTVNGAHRLSVDADGAVAFGGAVGGVTALAGLDVDAGSFSAASTINVGDLSIAVQTGDIAQSGAFSVGGNASFDAGAGNITLTNAGNDFVGAVDLRGGAVAITDANALTLGQVDATSLHATAVTIGLSGDVTTSGDQQYDGTLGLDADLALTAGGNVGFGATIDGAHRLSVDADGAVTFVGAVGAGTALAGLDVDAGSFSAGSTIAVAGDLSVAVQTGGIVQSGAFTVGGLSNFDAGSGAITLDHSGNDFTGAVSLTGGDVVINDSGALALAQFDAGSLVATSHGTLAFGAGTVDGALVADSNGGAITQSGGLVVGGTASLDAGTGAITLADAGNDFAGTVFLTGGVVAINDTNALALGTLDVGSLAATSHGALGLGQGAIAAGLSAHSDGGAITQSGPLSVGGGSSLDAGTGAIILDHAGNDFAGVVSLTGGAVSISDSNALAFGAVDVGSLAAGSQGALDLGSGIIAGGLDAQSSGGAITQSGALAVGGASAVDAGTGAITLSDAGNDFAGAISLAGGAVAISDANALALGALDVGSLSAVSQGALNLGQGTIVGDLVADSNGGAITQSGALAVGGSAAVDAGAAAITLTNAGNDFGGVVSLAGGQVSIADANALTLGALDAGSLAATSQGALGLGSGTIATGLVADSHGGAITQSGALAVGGASSLDAGSGAITLAHAGNDFTGVVSATGGVVSINDANALTLGTLEVGSLSASSRGALDLGGGTIAAGLVAHSNDGTITQSGALVVGGTSTIDAGTGDIGLSNAGNDFGGVVSLAGGAVAIRDAGTLALGSVQATSLLATATTIGLQQDIVTTGDQTYDGAVVLGGTVALDSDSEVTFGSTVSGAHGLSVDADGHVGFAGAVAVGALAVDAGSFSAASTLDVAGDLSLAVRSGGLVQVGAFRVGGSTDLDAGGGDILLTHVDNDFGGAVGLTGSAVAIRDRNDLTLSRLRSASGSDVHVTAGGALTLPAEALDAGSGNLHLAANGGTLTARARLAGGNVNLQGAGGIALGHDVDAAGTLQLDSGGDIAQAGGRISASVLTGSAGGSATLTGANRIGEVGAFSASGIELANAGPLAITGPLDARAGGLRLALSEGDLAIDGSVSAADIRLDIAGGITQGEDGQLLAHTLSGRAGGAVVLGDATRFVDNQVGQIGDFTAHDGFSMTNGRSLTLVSLNGSDFTIDAGSAEFFLSVDGDVRQDGTDWLHNGSGTWSATGGIGLPASPIYVMGLEAQTVAALGVPPAYFYAVRPDGSLLPIIGDAVNLPTSVWAGRAQTSSSRQVAYVDVGADASNYRGYGLVEPGVRLPDDQQPECDPDFPTPECEALQ